MSHHRIIAESGDAKGDEFIIPGVGLTLDSNGISQERGLWRIEVQDSQAVVLRVDEAGPMLPIRNGEGFRLPNAHYTYWAAGSPSLTADKREPGGRVYFLSENPRILDFPDDDVRLKAEFIVAGIHLLGKVERAAVLLDREISGGFYSGVYSTRPFPVDRPAIEAVVDEDSPVFFNHAGTICVVGIPEPGVLLYAEADSTNPFNMEDVDDLTQIGSGLCTLPATLHKRKRRGEDAGELMIADEATGLLPTFVVVAEPGTTLGPETDSTVPLLQRKYVAIGAEIVRRTVAAVGEFEAAAVIFTTRTPYGPPPEFWCMGIVSLSAWVVSTALSTGACSNVFGNICCAALHADGATQGFIYLLCRRAKPSAERLRKLQAAAKSVASLVREVTGEPCMVIGRSPAIAKVRGFIAEQAEKDTPVLIAGAAGTGKGLVAQAIHRASRRAHRPFALDVGGPSGECSVLDRLYGFAKYRYVGPMGRYNGGTLHLKAVDWLDIETQVELLRFMREGTYRQVGGTAVRRSDVRIILSLRGSAEEAVSEGRLLEDLYLEVADNRITLPELSEYRDDIPLLIEEFLRQQAQEARVCGIKPDAVELLKKRRWKTNVLGLEKAVAIAAAFAKTEWIESEGLLEQISHIR